jgi:hypothetical protein
MHHSISITIDRFSGSQQREKGVEEFTHHTAYSFSPSTSTLSISDLPIDGVTNNTSIFYGFRPDRSISRWILFSPDAHNK